MLTKLQAKYIQSLNEKKFRQQEKVFVAEGPKIVKELLKEGRTALLALYTTEAWWQQAGNDFQQSAGGKQQLVTAQELEKISFLTTANGMLALFAYPATGEPHFRDQITLVLDSIQDPGNMGTLLRIADWFGIGTIVAGADSADVFNPKVVQSSMGSLARVQVQYELLLPFLQHHKEIPLVAATLHGTPLHHFKPPHEAFLLIGNESKGIGGELLALSAQQITIPRIGQAESLNAAVAAGIILSHLLPVGG